MRVELSSDKNLIIHWRHTRKEAEEADGVGRIVLSPYKAITECNVLLEDDGETSVISGAVAMCSKKDNFSKAAGRKLSLRRALLSPAFRSFVGKYVEETEGEPPVSEGDLEARALQLREAVWEVYKDKCKV